MAEIKRPYSIPVSKRPKHKAGSNFNAIRRKAKDSAFTYTELSDTLDEEKSGFDSIIKARTEGAFFECCVLVANGDNLSALIKSKALVETDSSTILAFCQAKAVKRDEIVSDAVTSAPKWEIRRKARNIRRRLLRALLYRECGISPQDTQGARYNMLLNLAQNKGILP